MKVLSNILTVTLLAPLLIFADPDVDTQTLSLEEELNVLDDWDPFNTESEDADELDWLYSDSPEELQNYADSGKKHDNLIAATDNAASGLTDPELVHYDFILNSPLGSIAVTQDEEVEEEPDPRRYKINFPNVPITEYIKFISRISSKNFVYEESDLGFNVTIISEEPASVEEILAILMQELRINNLSVIEEGDNLLIHSNDDVIQPGTVSEEGEFTGQELITGVFRLHNVMAPELADVVSPMLSSRAVVQVLEGNRTIVISDLATNVNKVGKLIKTLDKPNSSMEIGRYVVRNTGLSTLIDLSNKIIAPLAEDNPLILVPQVSTNSIFIISTPYLVERTIAILYTLDINRRDRQAQQNLKTGLIPDTVGTNNGQESSKNETRTSQTRPKQRELKPLSSSQLKDAPVKVVRIQSNGELTDDFGRPFSTNSEGNLVNQHGQHVRIDESGSIVNHQGEPVIAIRSNTFSNGLGENYVIDSQGRFSDTKGNTYTPLGAGSYVDQNGNYFILDKQGRFVLAPIPLAQEAESDYPSFSYGNSADSSSPFDGLYDFTEEGITGGDLDLPDAWSDDLPIGHIQNTSFFIHKLEYRAGAEIEKALQKIGESLANSENVNQAFVSTVNSAQYVETSNAIVFTGDRASIERVKELIRSLDTPLRQVHIEMLIIETSVDNSLNFGVQWGVNTVDPDFAGSGGLIKTGSSLPTALGTIASGSPDASSFLSSSGFNLGVIGKVITNGADSYTSIGALVDAIRTDAEVEIIQTPRLVTEDGKPAEFFVGFNTRFRTDSIVNSGSDLVSTNFDYRDIGTRIKIRPLLGNSDMITLDIDQELSSETDNTDTTSDEELDLGPTTRKSTTNTRVHVQDGNFIVISGIISNQTSRTHNYVPCLGSIPAIGHLFGNTRNLDNKRNLMIFIRPQIITTPEDISRLTKKKHKEFRDARGGRKVDYTIDPGLDFLVPHDESKAEPTTQKGLFEL